MRASSIMRLQIQVSVLFPKNSKKFLTRFFKAIDNNTTSIPKKAVAESDVIMIGQVIEKIRIKDSSLAEAWSELAGNFVYDRILDLFPKP